MPARRKIAVVLLQLGGPDSQEAVQPFLYNLFSDPDIFDIPLGFLLRKPFAKWIASRRAPKVAAHYAEIGGASPLLPLTQAQAAALQRALEPHCDAQVLIAMRYWRPLTSEAVREVDAAKPDEIVLLPLYPQYSFATTGSSLNEWQRHCPHAGVPVRIVEHYCQHPLYIAAQAEKIAASLAQFDPARMPESHGVERTHLLFSAHGLPESFVRRGDPYQQMVEATVRLVMQHGGWRNPHSLCYQSKVGPQKWLEPSLHDAIHTLAHDGVKQVLVVPVSFVSEHIETLHEINIETRQEAEQLGIRMFRMCPALGDSPLFISCLADLVLNAVGLRASDAAAVRKTAASS
ncbi:MAG: ferrochelatase [Candidatus Acidiferrales bacterium]